MFMVISNQFILSASKNRNEKRFSLPGPLVISEARPRRKISTLGSPAPRILPSTLVKKCNDSGNLSTTATLRTEESGCCREVALVEVRLYSFKNYLNFLRCIRNCLTLFPRAIGTHRLGFSKVFEGYAFKVSHWALIIQILECRQPRVQRVFEFLTRNINSCTRQGVKEAFVILEDLVVSTGQFLHFEIHCLLLLCDRVSKTQLGAFEIWRALQTPVLTRKHLYQKQALTVFQK